MTKNSHIGGLDSGCKSGKYAPLCCTDVQVITSSGFDETCYNNALGYLLAGSLIGGPSFDPRRGFGFLTNGGESLAASRHKAFKAKRAASLEAPRHKKEPNNASTTSNGTLAKRGIHAGNNCLYQLAPDQIGIDIPAIMVQAQDLPKGSIRWTLSAATISTTTPPRSKPTETVRSTTTITTYTTETRTCDGRKYPQPCMHYRSVASVYGSISEIYSRPTCAVDDHASGYRPMVGTYNRQHHTSWSKYIAKSYYNPYGNSERQNCQRDEWPRIIS